MRRKIEYQLFQQVTCGFCLTGLSQFCEYRTSACIICEVTTMVNEKYRVFAFEIIEHAAHRKAFFMAKPVKPMIRTSYFFGGKLSGFTTNQTLLIPCPFVSAGLTSLIQ